MISTHFKTALSHIRRSPFQAISAIFVLSLTFFVATLLVVVFYSSEQVLRHFETRPQVIAFLNDDAASEEISALQETMQNDNRVSEVNYVSKEEALEIYKRATSDNPLLSELVSPSIFPASLEFSLSDLTHAESLVEDINSSEIVDQVGFTANLGGEDSLSEVVNRLRRATWYVRIGGISFAGLLMGTSFMVILIIIGMRMTTRRGEIEILDLIGATPGFIRSPILMEAVIYATLGVFVGWVLALVAVLYSTPSLIAYFGDISVLPRDTLDLMTLFGIILAGELIAGLILALTGSAIAVSRANKGK